MPGDRSEREQATGGNHEPHQGGSTGRAHPAGVSEIAGENAFDKLQEIVDSDLSPAEVIERATEDIGFARLDHDRSRRKEFPEVVYGEGKTPEQVLQYIEGSGPIPGEKLKDMARNIPDEAGMLLKKCLDRQPHARPGSADQIIRGLHHVLTVFKETYRDALIPEGLWDRLKR